MVVPRSQVRRPRFPLPLFSCTGMLSDFISLCCCCRACLGASAKVLVGAAAGEGAPPLPAATGLPAPPGATAGEISFLPKLIRLFETLFIFRGAPLALVLLKKKKGGDTLFTLENNSYFTGHPTPVFLPGESQEQRSLVDCSPWGR